MGYEEQAKQLEMGEDGGRKEETRQEGWKKKEEKKKIIRYDDHIVVQI
jgi:hypothetical protein